MAVVKTLIGNCKGPKGDPGEQGAPGAQGIKGADGIRGSRIVSGNAITGTSTSPASYATSIADSLVNDHYINTYNGNIYRCTKSGDANTAQWVFVGNVTSNNTFTIELGYIWEEIDSGISDVRSIASDGGSLLVAVGHNPDDVDCGNIAFSDNGGITWQIAPSVPVKTALNSVTFSQALGYFVAVGENGTILKSEPGSGHAWELVAEGPVEGKQEEYNMYPDSIRCVVWNDMYQLFAAVGGEAQGTRDTEYKHLILTSSDGQNWQRQYFNTGSDFTEHYRILTSIACDNVGGGTFAAGGNGVIVTSIDGQLWNIYSSDDARPDVQSIKFTNDNRYTGVTGGYKFYSGAGANIDEWYFDIFIGGELYDIETIDDLGIFISVGGNSSDSLIKYSSDGYRPWNESWTGLSDDDQSSEFRGTLLCVNHLPYVGTFIGRDDGKILKLTNTDIIKSTTEAVEEMYIKNINSDIVRKTLKQGETEISIADSRIKEDSVLSFYTSIYGVNPKEVSVVNGSVTLKFDVQEKDMEVGVRVDG